MSYYFNKQLNDSFDAVVEKTRAALAAEGFGVLTEINVAETMKKKLDKDMQPYQILGACHPPSAYQAISAEGHIGLMLPCNVIVRMLDGGAVEVAAVDPIASMQAVQNEDLATVARAVQQKLERVIDSL